MRHLASLVVGIGLAGCALPNAAPLRFDANLATRTEGVAFRVDSRWARVGMFHTTCEIRTTTGVATLDYDYAGEDDHVVDLHADDILVISEVGAFVTHEGEWNEQTLDPDVVDARLLDLGVVTAQDGGGDCTVSWTAGLDPVTVTGGCTALAADRETGQAWVGNAEGVHAAGPDELGTIDPEGSDLVAWDPGVDVLYAAHTGLLHVRALEADGTLRWEADLGAPVVDLDALGDRGLAMVLLAERDGTGTVVFLDGWSGQPVAEQTLPEVPLSLVAAPLGDRVAADRDTLLTFFHVSL